MLWKFVLFCFVLFDLNLSVCLWWYDYRRGGLPTLKFVVVIAGPLAIFCCGNGMKTSLESITDVNWQIEQVQVPQQDEGAQAPQFKTGPQPSHWEPNVVLPPGLALLLLCFWTNCRDPPPRAAQLGQRGPRAWTGSGAAQGAADSRRRGPSTPGMGPAACEKGASLGHKARS